MGGAFATFMQQQGVAGLKMAFNGLNLPGSEAAKFLLGLNGLAYVLYKLLPGKIENGPLTATGHLPEYVDNGLLHCIVFTIVFLGCSSIGLNLFDLGIIYDQFAPCI